MTEWSWQSSNSKELRKNGIYGKGNAGHDSETFQVPHEMAQGAVNENPISILFSARSDIFLFYLYLLCGPKYCDLSLTKTAFGGY